MHVQQTTTPSGRVGRRRAKGADLTNTSRAMSGAAGTLLGLWGLRHGGVSGLLGALAGGALIARAATGHRLVPVSDSERALAEREGWKSAAVTEASVTINHPRNQLYAYWRDFSNLPQLMTHLKRVEVLDQTRSHWVMEPPVGKKVEWTSSITEDRANERIAWRSEEDARIANSGWVEFHDAPGGGEGTEVRVQIAYQLPGGELGRIVAKMWPQAPGALLQDDLNEFKARIESGQISLPTLGSMAPGPH